MTARLPSRYRLAMPDQLSFTPIQEIPVPLNVMVARAPRVFVSAAVPRLCDSLQLTYQLPLYVTAGSSCSIRIAPCAHAGATPESMASVKTITNHGRALDLLLVRINADQVPS